MGWLLPGHSFCALSKDLVCKLKAIFLNIIIWNDTSFLAL